MVKIVLLSLVGVFNFMSKDDTAMLISSGSALLSGIPIFEIIKKKGTLNYCELLWQARQKLLQNISAITKVEIEKFNEEALEVLAKIIKSER